MSGTELWLRILAIALTAFVTASLRPLPAIESALFDATTMEQLVSGLRWKGDPSQLYALRAFFLCDFLFLAAHGWFFRRLLGTGKAALVMMAVDCCENIAALVLIDHVLHGAKDFGPWHSIYVVAYVGKWLTVGWTYLLTARMAYRYIRSYGFGGTLAAVGEGNWGTALASIYFLRAPLVTLAVLAAFPAMAFGPLRAFLFGLLHFYPDWSGRGGLLVSAIVGYFMAFLVPLQARIILVQGVDRLWLTKLADEDLRKILQFLQNAFLAAITLTLVAGVTVTWGPVSAEQGIVLVAWVVVILLFGGADLLAGLLTAQPLKPPLLLLPNGLGDWWQRYLRPLSKRKAPRWVRYISYLLCRQKVFKPLGYFDKTGYLYPEQASVICLFLMASVLYACVMLWVFGWGYAPPQSLASLLLLAILLAGAAGSLTFFFDRYRIPILLIVILLRNVTVLGDGADNVFIPLPSTQAAYQTPGQVLRQYAGKDAILIAASGGGIQAAAWMAHVIHKLDEERDIRGRVALVSAVSGGSVGAYHLGGGWEKGNWGDAELAVQQSSLGPISASLIGPDLFQPIVSRTQGGRQTDRGFALEGSIEKHHEEYAKMPGQYTLDDWAAKAGKGVPAFLFNTTVVETGGPVAFATTELPSAKFDTVTNPLSDRHAVRSARDLFNKGKCVAPLNVKVSTAARLSATFPYVSPAARLENSSDCLNHHFVDGGYYDNYGLVGLLQWLDDAMHELENEPAALPASIQILVIRGSQLTPEYNQPRVDQLLAPVDAFMNMRTYAQWSGIGAGLRLFLDKWDKPKAYITTIKIDYPDLRKTIPECAEEPLTWKLTESQKGCISRAWQARGPHGVK